MDSIWKLGSLQRTFPSKWRRAATSLFSGKLIAWSSRLPFSSRFENGIEIYSNEIHEENLSRCLMCISVKIKVCQIFLSVQQLCLEAPFIIIMERNYFYGQLFIIFLWYEVLKNDAKKFKDVKQKYYFARMHVLKKFKAGCFIKMHYDFFIFYETHQNKRKIVPANGTCQFCRSRSWCVRDSNGNRLELFEARQISNFLLL